MPVSDSAPTRKTAPSNWGGVREGQGRPRVLKDAKTKSVNLDGDHWRKLERLANRWGCSVSAAVRRLVSEACGGCVGDDRSGDAAKKVDWW